MPSSVGTISRRAPCSAHHCSRKYWIDGNWSAVVTTLSRPPPGSRHEKKTAVASVTFVCIETVAGAAPSSGATRSPTASGIVHHASAHARTPRVAQISAYCAIRAATSPGIAPSELLFR